MPLPLRPMSRTERSCGRRGDSSVVVEDWDWSSGVEPTTAAVEAGVRWWVWWLIIEGSRLLCRADSAHRPVAPDRPCRNAALTPARATERGTHDRAPRGALDQ
ncbi:MAG: hypothetical protein QOI29_722 [Mycobacterium sp.]|nr:hypothetical protein [Mycobacterium sp.]